MPTKKSSQPVSKKAKTPPPVMKKNQSLSHARASVSYITIVGWLIAYFVMEPQDTKYELFHLKQSLGLHLSIMVCEILTFVLLFLLPFLWIAYIVALVVFAIKAKEGKKELVPYLGQKFQEWFSFL